MSLPPLAPAETVALFLDFDGTLVEIVEHPDLVAIDGRTKEALSTVSGCLSSALAIVTGREIEVIDKFLAPLKLPVAGIHGLMRRDAAGHIPQPPEKLAHFVDKVAERLKPFSQSEAGLVLEIKASSVALHYRARPELERLCLEVCEAAIVDFSDVELKRGKMVFEIKPDIANKGTAILDYMKEAPFMGRTPWFAGDDVTDEDAFKVVNDLGGVTIKVGPGDTVAKYRASDTAEFVKWLAEAADKLGSKERT